MHRMHNDKRADPGRGGACAQQFTPSAAAVCLDISCQFEAAATRAIRPQAANGTPALAL